MIGDIADRKEFYLMKTNIKISSPDIAEAASTLIYYKRGKADLERRLMRESEVWRSVYEGDESSSWIFNSIVNKHADVIDSIPTCICLPREKRDEKAADALSKIIPVIAERSNFEQTYSDNSWNKLKNGTAIYGVFWNNSLEMGLGDIDIRPISISDIYWEPGISDIQSSKNVFITAYADIEQLEALYPHFNYSESKTSAERLSSSVCGGREADGKCLVVDWYYKKYNSDGTCVLHFCKFAGDCILYSSESDPASIGGWYEHGQYPVVFDNLYPQDSGVCGFGIISIADNTQKYINRIDENVLEYTDWASKVRFWAKRSLGVNEKEFLDLDKGIVEVEGDIDEEKLRQIEISPIDDSVIDVKRLKIDELKEITGSRDVSQGGITGGVTAASAISILREAGAKASRDGIAQTYRAYIRIVSLVIELIRQFYDTARVFRIIGESGDIEYLDFNGRDIRGGSEGGRPFFDIEVTATKKSPTEAAQKNQFARELYNAGAFDPAHAKETLMMLDLMDFEGIGKLKAKLRSEYLNNDDKS